MTKMTNKATLRGSDLISLDTFAEALKKKGWNGEPYQWSKLPDGSVVVTWENNI